MSNNPQTWTGFETALKSSVNYDGIGFMFSDSGYFGVDLDDCRDSIDSYLHGDKSDIIAEFIDTLQTYAEYSQSRNGIHLICRGSLPAGRRRNGKVEMYDSGRFFIMTGNAIGENLLLFTAEISLIIRLSLKQIWLSAQFLHSGVAAI